ncbi:hypothetical protein [Streptomyces sodiiphilus]|uniref:hypothetical protein n=1 Tax=Streptomyces sodiiphilus TaxID=226217 RepID=UPI0031DABD6C
MEDPSCQKLIARALLCPFAVLLAARGPELLFPADPFRYMLVYFVGVAAALVTLPAAISLAVASLGRILARLGARLGGPGGLVAGRWMSAHPGVTARLVAGLAIGIGLVGQVQVNASRLSEPMVEAQATAERIGTSVVTLKAPQDGERFENFAAALPPGVDVAALSEPDAEGHTTLHAPCDVLTRLQLGCVARQEVTAAEPDSRLTDLAVWATPGGGMTAVPGPVDEVPAARLVLLSASGGDLPLPELTGLAYRHLSLSPGVEPLGGGWLVGAAERAQEADWAILLGVFSVIFLGLAMAFNNAGEFLRFSRAAAPLSVLTGRSRLHFAAAGRAVLVPLLIGTALGLVTHYWLATPMTTPLSGGSVSLTALQIMGTVGAVLAISGWAAASVLSAVQARSWRPRAD